MPDDQSRRRPAARKTTGKSLPFLHELLRNLRCMSPVTHGQTLETVAQQIGLSKGQLSKIELGEISIPKPELLDIMLWHYRCPFELSGLVRYLCQLNPAVVFSDDDTGYRVRCVIREKVREVAESRKHNVVQFLDEFLPNTMDEIRSEWTIYHVSVNAITGSLRYDRNHWLRSKHRREWFIDQVCLPLEERRIFLVHRLEEKYWSKSNVTCIDGLFCYYEYQPASAQQQNDERPWIKASPESMLFFSSLNTSLRISPFSAGTATSESVAKYIDNTIATFDSFNLNDEHFLSEKEWELGTGSWRR